MDDGKLIEQLEGRRSPRAARLIGRDDAARLRWLIRFAEGAAISKSCKPAGFRKAAAAIEAFAERGGALAHNRGDDLTPAAATHLAQVVRDGLRAYVHQITPDFPALDFQHLQFSLVPGSDRSPWIGPWRPLFLIALGEVVRTQRDRLRTCAAADCGRLFFRRKRALYCSVACSQHERLRRFRENRERYRQRRHEYYLRRLARSKQVSVASLRNKVRRRPLSRSA